MSTTALTLTSESLEAAGIKTQLTQGDVVDVIVDELYDKIQEKLEKLPQPNIHTSNSMTEILKKRFLQDLVDNKVINKGQAEADTTYINAYSCSYTADPKKRVISKRINVDNGNSYDRVKDTQRLRLFDSQYDYIPNVTVIIQINFREEKIVKIASGEIKREITTTYSNEMFIDNPQSYKEFKKAITDSSLEHIDIFNSIPVKVTSDGKTISYANISRSVKSTVNKNIIKNQAPDIAKQLKGAFNIDF